MRNELKRLWTAMADDPDFVLLTGDLGFDFLEGIRDRMGARFVNAGIAEQNMISMAAGLSRAGFRAWTYTIGPFCYARAFEQIRLSLGFGGFPVQMVGNGGGLSYGAMGPEHHAAEDLALLQAVNGLRVFLPAGAEDLAAIVPRMARAPHPSYLRLSRDGSAAARLPEWAPLRRVLDGRDGVLIAEGPLAKTHFEFWKDRAADARPAMWIVGRLPLFPEDIAEEFWRELREAPSMTVLEEHVAHGGLGAHVLRLMAERGIAPRGWRWKGLREFPARKFGGREHHWREQGLWPGE